MAHDFSEFDHVVRVDPDPALVRVGHRAAHLDYKGALIVALLEREWLPIVTVDVDSEFLRDPSPELESIVEPFAMCPAPDDPIIEHAQGSCIERQSGLMAFPIARDHESIARLYRRAFDELRLHTSEGWRSDALLEERAWSLVHARLAPQVTLLPRTLNWSRLWGMPPHDVALVHHHGNAKFILPNLEGLR
jgi:hypothetical protein